MFYFWWSSRIHLWFSTRRQKTLFSVCLDFYETLLIFLIFSSNLVGSIFNQILLFLKKRFKWFSESVDDDPNPRFWLKSFHVFWLWKRWNVCAEIIFWWLIKKKFFNKIGKLFFFVSQKSKIDRKHDLPRKKLCFFLPGFIYKHFFCPVWWAESWRIH